MRLVVVQYQSAAEVELEEYVEEAVGVARVERVQIQPADRCC